MITYNGKQMQLFQQKTYIHIVSDSYTYQKNTHSPTGSPEN